jgi:dipeptidyl aminopeptidase/acylaminoacyl peptidase
VHPRVGFVFAIAILAAACNGAAAPSSASSSAASPASPATPTGTPLPEATVTPTAVAAPSGRIAFRRDLLGSSSQVFIVDVDGSNEVKVTQEAGGVDHLVWAPDGSRLYFESIESGGCGETICFPTHLVSIRPDGTGRVDLGQVGTWSLPTAGEVPAVSPDGRYAAYPAGEGYSEDLTSSFPIDALVVDLVSGTIASLGIASSAVLWSPDGSRLLLAVPGRIIVVDAQSRESVVRIDDPWVQADSPVGWSADSGSIFYHRCDPDLDKDAAMACFAGPSWVVDLADPNLVAMANAGPEPPEGPLSPDGSWTASFRHGMSGGGLYLTPTAGGVPVLVSRLDLDGSAFEHPPSWSPDGAWLAVGIPDGIHVVPAAGGEPRFVAAGAAPAWQPTSD